MTAPPPRRCPLCGHTTPGSPCHRCGDTIEDLAGEPVRPGPLWPQAFAQGLRAAFRGVLQVTLRREFVGQLWLPVLGNLAVTLVLGGLALGVVLPLWNWVLHSEWFVFDGLRRGIGSAGPLRLTVATIWLLAPPLLALAVGALLEPLHAATEVMLGGPGMRAAGERSVREQVVHGARFPVRVLVLCLCALPVVAPLALLSWVGLPLAMLAGGAAAGAVFVEPAAARRGLDQAALVRLLRRNWALVLGLGVGIEAALLVPFVNLLAAAPAAAVAAAAVYFRFDKRPPQP